MNCSLVYYTMSGIQVSVGSSDDTVRPEKSFALANSFIKIITKSEKLVEIATLSSVVNTCGLKDVSIIYCKIIVYNIIHQIRIE